ncbi:MAG: type II toxin-antitoxin system VapC family toxin [Acidobacteriota bacterium]
MILLDTCALIWSVNQDPISPEAVKAISKASRTGALFLSPVSAWEIGVLASRSKLKLQLPAETYVLRAFARPGVRVAHLTPEIAVRASYLPGDFHADPADRLLVATAMALGLKLVTRDQRILRYGAAGYVAVLAC